MKDKLEYVNELFSKAEQIIKPIKEIKPYQNFDEFQQQLEYVRQAESYVLDAAEIIKDSKLKDKKSLLLKQYQLLSSCYEIYGDFVQASQFTKQNVIMLNQLIIKNEESDISGPFKKLINERYKLGEIFLRLHDYIDAKNQFELTVQQINEKEKQVKHETDLQVIKAYCLLHLGALYNELAINQYNIHSLLERGWKIYQQNISNSSKSLPLRFFGPLNILLQYKLVELMKDQGEEREKKYMQIGQLLELMEKMLRTNYSLLSQMFGEEKILNNYLVITRLLIIYYYDTHNKKEIINKGKYHLERMISYRKKNKYSTQELHSAYILTLNSLAEVFMQNSLDNLSALAYKELIEQGVKDPSILESYKKISESQN